MLPGVLEQEVQTSLKVAQTEWIASLDLALPQVIEKTVPAINKTLLSDAQASIEKRMSDQARRLLQTQRSDTEALVKKVTPEAERALPFYPQPSP